MDLDISRESETRFAFGENWLKFSRLVDDETIVAAAASIQKMLGSCDLETKRLLDIGCGSGLFSLAARRLGASVVSFDYDGKCVTCAEELKQRYQPADGCWRIEQGSVLDRSYLSRLGTFDVVYSWGVLHHTGDMWAALNNAAELVAQRGTLFISLYNDQGWISTYWKGVKKIYNQSQTGKITMTVAHVPYLIGLRVLVRLLKGKFRLERGMSFWHDAKDWLGGYPFEVSSPDQIITFFKDRRFKPINVVTAGRRSGCNEFVFEKID